MEKINIGEILPPRVLLRKHNKLQIKELCNSIKEFGQYKPLLIQESSMRIICGYGIYLALKKLKIKEVYVIKLDICDEECDNIRFTDNYSNESSRWNEDKLQYIFMSLPDELINISGFDNTEIENLFNDSEELLKKEIEKIEKNEDKKNPDELKENEIIDKNEENVENKEDKEDKIDVEFIKIHYCGCCGKYYDSDGNEVSLLR